MKNTCKHENAKLLTPGMNARWFWCPDCGATRLDVDGVEGDENCQAVATTVTGKWKSPKCITNKKSDDKSGAPVDRRRDAAGNKEQYDAMVRAFLAAECKKDMETVSYWYITDIRYSKPDVCLAMKTVEKLKGWDKKS